MNVKDLRELLSIYPDELEVLFYSEVTEYTELLPSGIKVISAIPLNNKEWYIESYPKMTDVDKEDEKTYLAFSGN